MASSIVEALEERGLVNRSKPGQPSANMLGEASPDVGTTSEVRCVTWPR